MSFALMKWALRLPVRMPHAAARVLMVLADHADDRGENCYPSLDTIAGLAQMDRSTAVRAIANLRQHDVVRIEEGGKRGRARSTRYLINLRAGQPKAKPAETPDLFPETVATGHTKAVDQSAGRTVKKSGATPHLPAKSVAFTPQKCGVTPHDSIQNPISDKPTPVVGATPAVRLAVDNTVAVVAAAPPPAPPAPPPDPKGMRLADDWRPSANSAEVARQCGLDPEQVLVEFRDYWQGVPGKDGRKTDRGWDGAYRNRCRWLKDRGQRGSGPPTKLSQNEIMRRAIYGDGDGGHSGPTIEGEAYAAQPYGAVR